MAISRYINNNNETISVNNNPVNTVLSNLEQEQKQAFITSFSQQLLSHIQISNTQATSHIMQLLNPNGLMGLVDKSIKPLIYKVVDEINLVLISPENQYLFTTTENGYNLRFRKTFSRLSTPNGALLKVKDYGVKYLQIECVIDVVFSGNDKFDVNIKELELKVNYPLISDCINQEDLLKQLLLHISLIKQDMTINKASELN